MIKKKILILGVNGLLGNRVFLNLSKNKKLNIYGLARKKSLNKSFSAKKIIYGVDVSDFKKLRNTIKLLKPDVILNCVGVINKKIKSIKEAKVIKINSLLPHYLDNLSAQFKFKLIHISTDCIFKGNKNFYNENSLSDVDNLYGLSKSAGEINNNRSLTIRTSIIGHELNSQNGLVDWFLSQKTVFGFANVIYSGMTTNELSKIIENCILRYNLRGLYQVSSAPISKFDLLKLINNIYNSNINIKKNISIKKKLVLKSDRFKKETKYRVSSWEKQIIVMKNER